MYIHYLTVYSDVFRVPCWKRSEFRFKVFQPKNKQCCRVFKTIIHTYLYNFDMNFGLPFVLGTYVYIIHEHV